jgi:cytochrome b
MRIQASPPNIPYDNTAQADAPPLRGSIRIALWDLPVRIFHWSLLAAVGTAIVTGQLGGSWMSVHGKAGLVIIALVVFRVLWGFFGSTYARFVTFVPTPGQLRAYLRGQWSGAGHNPLGALSVLALLGLLALQAGTGLFGNDDIAFTGPWAESVSEALSHKLTGWHQQLATALYALLGLHVLAIVFYERIKKDKLLKPMLTGWKEVAANAPPPRKAGSLALWASILLALGAAYGASGGWLDSATNEQSAPAQAATATPKPAAASPAW